MNYIKASLSNWKTWWKSPTTKEDRTIGLIIGGIGGSIIGVIIRIFWGEVPAPLAVFAMAALLGLITGGLFGVLFPKPVTICCAPFIKLLDGL